jgi:hypothetical protein
LPGNSFSQANSLDSTRKAFFDFLDPWLGIQNHIAQSHVGCVAYSLSHAPLHLQQLAGHAAVQRGQEPPEVTLWGEPQHAQDFCCWDVVEAYESVKCGFIIVARKTVRLVEQVKAAAG